jgi:hypothetical protein
MMAAGGGGLLDAYKDFCGFVASHPVAKNFFTMIRFFRIAKCGRLCTEEDRDAITYNDHHIFKVTEARGDFARPPTDEVALSLISEWWSGNKTTDAIRELLVKLVTVNFYKTSIKADKSKSVGSSEFLEQFFTYAMKLELPAEFIAWAIKGTTHRHCKKALQEIGVPQVRRAEGQRFVGLFALSEEQEKELEKPEARPYTYAPLYMEWNNHTAHAALSEYGHLPGLDPIGSSMMAPYGSDFSIREASLRQGFKPSYSDRLPSSSDAGAGLSKISK